MPAPGAGPRVWRVCRACLRRVPPAARTTPLLQRCAASRALRLTPHARALRALAALEIDTDDGFPQQICSKCVHSLKQALHFKLKCEQSHKILKKLKENNTNIKMDLIEYSMFAHHFPEYTTETTLNCSEKSPKNVDNPSENTSNNFQISSKNFVFTLTPIKTTEVKVTCTDTVKDEQTIDKVSETPRHDEDDLSDSSERIFDSMLQSEIPEVTNHDSVNAKPKVEKSVEQTRLPKLVLKKARIIEKDEDDHTLRRVKKRKIIKETEDDDRVQKLEVKKARMKIANLRRLAKNQDKYKLTEKQVSYIKRKLSIIENTKRKITKLKKTREQAFCKVCKKSFSSKGALEMHSQQHFGYNFVCHICAKGTATNTALQRHLMNIHGLQKPYSCDLCNYKGVCKFQMKEHIRTHTGERPFTCDKCGLTFRRKAIWTEHQYLHGEKRFKCDQCPSGFYTRGQLNVHVNNIHKRQYVYQCTHPGCDTTYAKSTTVRRHLTSAHGVPRAQQGKITKINI